jgi:hypothetical protein
MSSTGLAAFLVSAVGKNCIAYLSLGRGKKGNMHNGNGASPAITWKLYAKS